MAGLHDYTVFSGISLNSDASNTFGMAMNGKPLSLATGSFSIQTFSLQSQIPVGNMGLVFQASGISLMYRASAGSVYIINSATSGAP